VYVYARAGRYGWPGPWRAAVAHGLEALETHYRRSDGLYRRMVDPHGAPLDETALVYEQAFVLLALAEAARVAPDPEPLIARAEALRAALEALRWRGGGFKESDDWPFQANCHMHLFESCLAWLEVEGAARAPWFRLASEIARLALGRFIAGDHGVLHEVFDGDWRVASAAAGGCFDPGHQFEWAWLLDQWSGRGGEVDRGVIRRLYYNGRAGWAPERGVVINRMSADFAPLDASARIWPQTEHLRAAVMMWRTEGEAPYAAHVAAAASGLAPYLETPVAGLWRDVRLAEDAFAEEPAPASSLYHLICLLQPPRAA
jgi:mannose-6-phosphate isomerase